MALKLILVGGSLATGKTTLARALAENLSWPRVSMDEIKETLFDVGGYRDRAWSKDVGRLAWPVFQGLIEMYLSRGESVIAEATFLWPDDALWVEEMAEKYQAILKLLWLTADPAVARQRFLIRATSGHRHPGHCDALEHVLQEFDERFFCKTFPPLPLSGETMVIDTTSGFVFEIESVKKFLF